VPHISRHELKTDEFVSFTDTAYEFYLEHQKQVLIYGTVVAVVAAVVLGSFFWYRSRTQAAASALSAALATYHAQLPSPGQPPPAGGVTFTSAVARAAAAQSQFKAVADKYGRLKAGQLARYYYGLTQLDLGKTADGEATLKRVAGHGGSEAAPLAQFALAGLYQSEGKTQQAIAALQKLEKSKSAVLARPAVLMQLAELEKTSNPVEARKIYQQLSKDYPNTSTGQQAAEQLVELH
jgi:TolA-binding protein